MKFFHLSDLHIGKQLHHYNLREDQEKILSEIVDYAKDLHPDAVIIAGDIYDKSVPSAEAVTVFDEFLTSLSAIRPAIPVLIISGNHDSAERLLYASKILQNHQIYMAGQVPGKPDEFIQRVTLEDAFGEVDFYLLPFLKPSYIRNVFEEEAPQSYSDAVGKLLWRENIDYQGRRNVLVSHQFYTGNGEVPVTCDSEMISVGGIDNVDISAVKEFDYVALGHIHRGQQVGYEHIRYCGTPLKYSVSESGHEKSLAVVTLGAKGEKVKIETLPFHPLRDVRAVKGELADLLLEAREENRDDYISVTLTDEIDPYKPKDQLERVYSHILEIRVDNLRTRKKLSEYEKEIVFLDPFSAFQEFYEEIQDRKMSEEELEIMEEIFEKAKGE